MNNYFSIVESNVFKNVGIRLQIKKFPRGDISGSFSDGTFGVLSYGVNGC